MTDYSEPFRAVDAHLRAPLPARALDLALRAGLIDALAAQSLTLDDIASRLEAPVETTRMLIALLESAQIVGVTPEGAVALTEVFRAALDWRDLLEARLAHASAAWRDLFLHTEAWLHDDLAHDSDSEIFNLYRYDLASEATLEGVRAASAWVRITTALTRYEAPALVERIDFSAYKLVTEVGGNSGECARQICAANPNLQMQILDLPAVCDIGRRHLADTPEGARIVFVPIDARSQPWPEDADAVLFKSMLHDWPDRDVARLLARANAALKPGGHLLIFERAKTDPRRLLEDFSAAPNIVFAPFYRAPERYAPLLETQGFALEHIDRVEIDCTFMILRATKKTSISHQTE